MLNIKSKYSDLYFSLLQSVEGENYAIFNRTTGCLPVICPPPPPKKSKPPPYILITATATGLLPRNMPRALPCPFPNNTLPLYTFLLEKIEPTI